MKTPPLQTRNTAFTFVELLMVIGLMAVLLALLIPVAKRISRTGKEAACAANLRTFGVAILALTSDRGELPPPTVDPVTEKESSSNYWGWLTSGEKPYLAAKLRCPLVRKGDPNHSFNYAGSESIYSNYRKVQFAGIPAPAPIVPLAMESYAGSSGFYATVHVFMTLWGTKDGLGSNNPALETLRGREEEARRAQYHGGGVERSLLVFYLDGHVAPFAPRLGEDGTFDASAIITPSKWAWMKRNGIWKE